MSLTEHYYYHRHYQFYKTADYSNLLGESVGPKFVDWG